MENRHGARRFVRGVRWNGMGGCDGWRMQQTILPVGELPFGSHGGTICRVLSEKWNWCCRSGMETREINLLRFGGEWSAPNRRRYTRIKMGESIKGVSV